MGNQLQNLQQGGLDPDQCLHSSQCSLLRPEENRLMKVDISSVWMDGFEGLEKKHQTKTYSIGSSLAIYAQQILVTLTMNKITFIFILCVWMFYGMLTCALHVCSALGNQKRNVGSSETTGRDDCQPQCGYWELNLGPLELQPVFLTADPSLQPALLSL